MQQVKRWAAELAQSLLFGAIELIVYFPILLLIHLYTATTPLWATMMALAACYAAGCLGGLTRILLRSGLEYLFAILCSSAIAIAVQGNNWHGWVYAIVGLPFAYRGIQFTKTNWLSLFPSNAYLFGFAAYFISVPFFGRIAVTAPYAGVANGLGILSLLIFLFHLNREQLLRATLASTAEGQAALSGSVKSSSRIWLTVLASAIVGIAFVQQMKQALFRMIGAFFSWLGSFMHSEPAVPEPPPAPPEQPMLPPAQPQGEPSWLSILWDYIQVILGYLIVAAFVIFALYLIVSKLAPALSSLIRRLLGRTRFDKEAGGAEGYTDEKESLFEWKQVSQEWWNRLSGRFRRAPRHLPAWTDLTNNRERVRYLYALLVREAAGKGYALDSALTPNETGARLSAMGVLPEAAAQKIAGAYNQVRYGELEVSDTEVREALEASGLTIRKERQ